MTSKFEFLRVRLIHEFLGHACPRSWLAELALNLGMSTFPGLNSDIFFVAYSQK